MPTSLLLHFDGPNNSTTFIDEVGLGITPNGSVKISTAQSKFGGASGLFDGDGDYLTASYSTGIDLLGSAFTIEGWIYPTVNKSSGHQILSLGGSNNWNNTTGIHILFQLNGATNKLNAQFSNGTSTPIAVESVGTVTLNAWNHVSCSINGTTAYLSINGTVESFAIASVVRPSGNPTLAIGTLTGESGNPTYAYQGYMDELRITKGEALYTANFVPPAQQFFYQNTVLLLHCDGTNGSTTFRDETGKTVTANGNAQISTAQSKFGGSSLLLDGNGDYLAVPASSDLDFGSGDFTFEAWIYPTATPATAADIATTNGGTNGCGLRLESNRKVALVWNIGGTSSGVTSTTALNLNQWYHVAGVRRGTNTHIFVDGVLEATVACGSGAQKNPGVGLSIGRNATNSSWYYTGYIDDLRICKAAKYTATFTPPIAPHEFEYTTLLIHADGSNGQTCIREETGKAVAVSGNAQISTAQSKFGGASALFDGAGDYLNIADAADWDFGTGDFTIEFWVNRLGAGSGDRFLIDRGNGSRFLVRWTADGNLQFFVNLTLAASSTFPFTIGTWYHLALTRSSGSVRAFVDGVQVGTTQSIAGAVDGTEPIQIGGYGTGNSDYFNGHIDEIRISKGIARYTANFTPPSRPFTLLGQYTYRISGNVYDDTGTLVARTIRLYRRDTGALVAETTSTGGTFTFQNPEDREYYVVALDDAAGTQLNALIFDKVTRG